MNGSRIVFKDARLAMSLPGRMLTRVVSLVADIIAVAACFVFLSSPVPALWWLGAFLLLYLADRFLHLMRPDKTLDEIPAKGSINLAEYLTPQAYRAIERAYDRSILRRTDFVLEALAALLRLGEIKEVFERLEISPGEFEEKLDEQRSGGEYEEPAMENFLGAALLHAAKNGSESLGVFEILSSIGFSENPKVLRLLNMFSLDSDDLAGAATMVRAGHAYPFWKRAPQSVSRIVLSPGRRIRHRVVNRAWTSRPTPTLDKFSRDLTDLAREYEVGFLIGHEAEYRRLTETLSRSINPNALLLGEQGSGKETIIAHLAYNLVHDKVPRVLFDKRLVALDLALLVSSAAPEELQARLSNIMEEVEMAGNIILYVPDIHNLVRTSGTAYLSAADAILPVIMNNAFPVVGATYPREWKQLIEPRSNFASLFDVIRVNEISEAEAERILIFESVLLERRSGIKIGFGAVKAAVSLAKKYIRPQLLPSSAEELLKSAVAEAEGKGDPYVGAEDVVSAAEARTNVPLRSAGEKEAQKLLNLESVIHERLVDQEEAVKAVSSSLREYRSGLARRGGPIASFLFVGPTGVGKTELAKILSSIQFGSESSMLRFDMTEFQDTQSFYRFIGSPDGSVSGALTDAILEKPYGLILLDEFEKAHSDILELFLQVLDDGRITDNLGRVVNFENTIIIATSNAHSDFITESLRAGGKMENISEELKRKLTSVFRPELLNRFSKIIVFRNLSPEDLVKIAELNLKSVADLAWEQGIELSFSARAVKKIAELGYDPAFGARPLRGVINDTVRSPLSEAILRREAERGARIVLDYENNGFSFRKAE